MTDCLDSWVVIQWLGGEEPARARVESALATRPVMSWINLGEVAYLVERRAGTDRANRVIGNLTRRLTLDVPARQRVLEAARIKARYPMAYADAFAVATAVAHRATLLTGDPEILGAGGEWALEDLRG